jgi:MerR family mercuric resistance operon transcriptional regulator
MEGMGRIAIGRLSKHTGTNIETIRYYERVGLLPASARSSGGYRLYGTDQLKRLNFIRRARALGFSLAEVRKLLTLADQKRRPCAEVRVVAAAHLEDVKGKIADLRQMERVLKETVARCEAGSGSHCPMIDALYTDSASGGASWLRKAEPGPRITARAGGVVFSRHSRSGPARPPTPPTRSGAP